MNQAQIANLAQRAALRTVQTDIGNCASCVPTTSMLAGFGCDCEKTGVANCSGCKSKLGAWTKEFGDVAGSLWDTVKPAFPWILLAGVVAGFVGWKTGIIFCNAKHKVVGNKKRKKK